MMQLKAGIKKEWLELCKTGRLLGILLVIIGLSVFDPVMIRFLALLMEVFQDAPSMASLEALSGVFGQQTALASYAADCVSTGLLVVFLLLMRTAGGEQKRRSVVIRLSAVGICCGAAGYLFRLWHYPASLLPSDWFRRYCSSGAGVSFVFCDAGMPAAGLRLRNRKGWDICGNSLFAANDSDDCTGNIGMESVQSVCTLHIWEQLYVITGSGGLQHFHRSCSDCMFCGSASQQLDVPKKETGIIKPHTWIYRVCGLSVWLSFLKKFSTVSLL